ncbi:gastrula zinc finger protein XlCGF26.1 [Folsomia candida]|nr:gastrula zinc finger protein XlCGF26.1 [Folsomia candida]
MVVPNTNPKKYSCPNCSTKLASAGILKRHVATVHSDDKPFPCDTCNYRSKTEETLKMHKYLVHTNVRQFVCDKCDKRFKTRQALKLHTRSRHTERERNFRCDKCDTSFQELSHLKVHHIRVHDKKVSSHPCELCGKTFKSIYYKNDHLRNHLGELEKFPCPHPGCQHQAKTLQNFSTHAQSHLAPSVRDKFPCPHCDKVFLVRVSLKSHLEMHKNGSRFKCDFPACGATLLTRAVLKSHARTHTNERPHACPHCSMNFLQAGNMRRHIRTKHMDDSVSRIFKCPLCPAKFKTGEDRNRHEKTHLDESKRKTLACPHCPETFVHVATFKSHVQRFHTLPQDRERFPCEFSNCNAIFATKQGMRVHFRRRHTTRERKFKCYFCPKDFVSWQYLTGHVRVHTNEKPYSCAQCAETFKGTGLKHQHLRLHHTTRKRLQCPHCENTYLLRTNLETHITQSHDPDLVRCGLCKLSLPSRKKLENHIRAEHTKENPYPCKICRVETASYKLLKRHVIQNHKNTLPHFKCGQCPQTSISRVDIKIMRKRITLIGLDIPVPRAQQHMRPYVP